MWKTWRWKASRRTASHPLGTYSWVPKTTPLTRASVCQLETVSAPGCLKSAFVEKVRDWPISPHCHQRAWPSSLWWLQNQLPPHLYVNPPKMSFQSATMSPAWYLTFPMFEHARFYSIHGSMINCADCVCGGHWSILWWSLRVIALIRQSSQGLTHEDSVSLTDTVTPESTVCIYLTCSLFKNFELLFVLQFSSNI